MRVLAVLAVFALFNFVFWAGWLVLFGPPTGGMRYAALALCIVLYRVGWHFFHHLLPKA